MKYGAIINPIDPRDVPVTSFQKVNKLPKKHITDISHIPVLDQMNNGSCVGHAVATAIAYYEIKEHGKNTNPSPRYLYGLAKRMDGLASEGTYPRIVGNIARNLGCATENTVPNVNSLSHQQYISFPETDTVKKDAEPRKIGGYAFANADINQLRNAIINNGVVCVSLTVGNWNGTYVKGGNNGRHYILVYGYDNDVFLFRNSWGTKWGKKGNGMFKWLDHKDTIRDIMVITDIPNKVIEKAKAEWKYKYFKPTERTGSMGTVADLKPELLDKLDKAREIAGVPFVITSGYRTPEHNKKVGGEPNSAHLLAKAVDVSCTDSVNRMKIIESAIKAGFKRIGIGKSYIHLDVATKKEDNLTENVIWHYY